MDMNLFKLILFSIVILESVPEVCFAKTQKAQTTCEDFARNIFRHSQKEKVNINRRELDGIWTSSSCEAYNGPQFILRKYVIGQDGKWSADYYHYKDGWCSQLLFTVSMKGVYKIGGKNSLGGHVGEFTAKSFLLTPHNEEAFIELVKVSKQYCARAGLPTLQKDKNGRFIIPKRTNFTMRKDVYRNSVCRRKFGIHLYTHKLVKLLRDKHNGDIKDKLYFGEVPTRQTRRSFIPSAYHFPLSRSSSQCEICRRLESAKASDTIRLTQPKEKLKIEGEWTSPTCQAMSETFMSRFLKFSPPDRKGQRKWKLVYYFFLDSSCKVLSYKILARGTYTDPTRSTKLAGAYNVAFNLTDTEITPYEKLIVQLLHAEPRGTCGVTSKWNPGIMQSVKNTKGCRMFRISIPSVEYDVLKPVQNDNGELDLYTGQSSTDQIVPDSPDKRPSSFQLPLRRCRDLVTGKEEPRKRSTIRTPKKRKINIQIPAFTIPKGYFRTIQQRNTKPLQTSKNSNTIPVEAGRNPGSVASVKLAGTQIIAACILACLVVIGQRD